jgi:hypothetical protein
MLDMPPENCTIFQSGKPDFARSWQNPVENHLAGPEVHEESNDGEIQEVEAEVDDTHAVALEIDIGDKKVKFQFDGWKSDWKFYQKRYNGLQLVIYK